MSDSNFRVLVAVGEQEQMSPLLSVACALAHVQDGGVILLCVTPNGDRPDWLRIPEQCDGVNVHMVVRAGTNAARSILQVAREIDPNLLLLGWSGGVGGRSYLLGSTLDPVVRFAPCDVAVVHGDDLRQVRRVLVPMSSGPNAPLALDIALQLAPQIEVTALYVARQSLGPTAQAAGNEQLRAVLEPWADDSRVSAKVVCAGGVIEGILQEAASGYDMLLIGASNESYIDRKLFGNVPQSIALAAPVPALIVKQRVGMLRTLLYQAGQRLSGIQGDLSIAQRVETYREVHRGARSRPDFYVLVVLAAAIATLGLLMDSAAVIIGAMVIAPLMSAILGISLGVVQGDARLLWRSAYTTLRGAALAVLIGVLVSAIAPGKVLTGEILGRTQPTLFDLGVALLSGFAGAYAQCRREVLSAVSGVAIAVALVPPLATVGIGITMLNWTVATGALLLFLTNLSAIVAAASMVLLLFGFRPDPGRRLLVFGRSMIGVVMLLLFVSVALTVLTVQSTQTALISYTVQDALTFEIDALPGVELDDWKVERGGGKTLHIWVQVRATHAISYQDTIGLQERIEAHVKRPVLLVLDVVPIARHDLVR
ncbi:MAG: DUF389 domain-containing protein [Anaerolineae bacterium]|nr:DUF389 domain-containing protein [Anaerolineae bacterium]